MQEVANRSELGGHETRLPRLLLVEDSSTLRRLLTQTLAQRDMNVTTAIHGLEGVETLKTAEKAGQPFDVVIMDVVMPELDGFQATWQMRKLGYAGKVILFTANDEMYDMAASLCQGADDFIAKPFSPAQLIEVIERQLATMCPLPEAV